MKKLVLIYCIVFSALLAQAEIVFPWKTLKFVSHPDATLKVEVAATPSQKTQGLMNRESLPDGKGMIFIFQSEQHLSFWMKNTTIPLSIGFFDKQKVLIEVFDMDPVIGPVREETLPRYESSRPAMYALEVPKGWFAKNKIKAKDRFILEN